MRLRWLAADNKEREHEFALKNVRLGRDPSCEIVFDAAMFPKVSGLHAEFIVRSGVVWLIHHSKSNSTVLGDTAIERPTQLKPGDRVRLGFTGPEIEFLGIRPSVGGPETIAHDTGNRNASQSSTPDATLFAQRACDLVVKNSMPVTKFPVRPGTSVGRQENCSIFLEHPHVSRRHAQLNVVGEKTVLIDTGSSNGTFVNGTRIRTAVEIKIGDIIDIGPFTLVFDGNFLISRSRINNIQIDVENLSFVVTGSSSKRSVHLLSGVSFRDRPGEFTSVIGPSGSGKSTLLGIVSGRSRPFSGHVNLNGRNLHQNFGALKEEIVVMPQAPALHESLTVRQTIRYVCQLRLPGDTAGEEMDKRTSEILSQVGLSDRAQTKVNQLSGGQLKRLGLACELSSDPSLLFLDEVTSGLDEHSDGEMMSLFRELADNGKTIICVTHNLGHVESRCHNVLVLTKGGRVAFFGAPQKACNYFDVRKLADIYAILETRSPMQWATLFLKGQSKISPAGENSAPGVAWESETQSTSVMERLGVKPIRQTAVLTCRYVQLWLGDRMALSAMMGQAVLVTILPCIVFNSIPEAADTLEALTRKTEIRNLLFLTGISCFWLGANNSAKEIVKERRIYQRERDFNLVPEAYWASKIIVLGTIGILQASFLTISVSVLCALPGNITAIWATGLLLSFVGTNLGLAVSSCSRTEELAATLIPAVIIPQIILAGVVASLDSISLFFAKFFTTSFWGQKLSELAIPETDRLLADFEPTWKLCVLVLVMHCLVFLLTTWLGLRFRKTPLR